ncbi:hypothetical protein KSP40_PGU007432 [Platanthera guangdongensis]|uniref:Uncharacterized protein n=1 Tax=Platanthera guangdongensis TaxID=2320717 RepID=A0ABR2LL08_9ASPA
MERKKPIIDRLPSSISGKKPISGRSLTAFRLPPPLSSAAFPVIFVLHWLRRSALASEFPCYALRQAPSSAMVLAPLAKLSNPNDHAPGSALETHFKASSSPSREAACLRFCEDGMPTPSQRPATLQACNFFLLFFEPCCLLEDFHGTQCLASHFIICPDVHDGVEIRVRNAHRHLLVINWTSQQNLPLKEKLGHVICLRKTRSQLPSRVPEVGFFPILDLQDKLSSEKGHEVPGVKKFCMAGRWKACRKRIAPARLSWLQAAGEEETNEKAKQFYKTSTFSGAGSQGSGRFSSCQIAATIILKNNLSTSTLPNSKVRTVIVRKLDLIMELVRLIWEREVDVMDAGLRCLMRLIGKDLPISLSLPSLMRIVRVETVKAGVVSALVTVMTTKRDEIPTTVAEKTMQVMETDVGCGEGK